MNASDCRTTVVLPVDLRDQVAERAQAADRSISAEVRVALREHISRSTSSSPSATGLAHPASRALGVLGAGEEKP